LIVELTSSGAGDVLPVERLYSACSGGEILEAILWSYKETLMHVYYFALPNNKKLAEHSTRRNLGFTEIRSATG
jgi:hypothetical protein